MRNTNLGEKVKAARISKKMTQSEVAGDFITRNMLSQIENGAATPSIRTIEYLCRVLERPVSYFMEDKNEFEDQYSTDIKYMNLDKALILFENKNYEGVIKEIDMSSNEKIQENTNSEEIIYYLFYSYWEMGKQYKKDKEYRRALENFKKAGEVYRYSHIKSIYKLTKFQIDIDEILLNIEEVSKDKDKYVYIDNFEKVNQLYQRSLVLKVENTFVNKGSKETLKIINDINNIIKTSNASACLNYIKAKAIVGAIVGSDILKNDLITMEVKENQKEDVKKALYLLDKAETVFIEENNVFYLRLVYQLKSKIYSLKGDFQNAYLYLNKIN